MVATRLFEINGSVNGTGGSWPDELSTPGNASGSFYQERRMDDSRKISVLRNGDATTHRSNSADRDDCGRASDQIGRQSVAPGEWGQYRHICSGVDSRSIRSVALATFRSQRENEQSRRVRRVHWNASQSPYQSARRRSCLPGWRSAFAYTRTIAR